MRASDADRDLVTEVLGEAYADGRLTRDEFDERAETTATSRTLGELVPVIDDLVAVRPRQAVPGRELALASDEQLRREAVEKYEAGRRQALVGWLMPTLITFAIWFATGFGDGGWHANFPWPIFVMLGTGANMVRVLVQKPDIIKENYEKLQKKRQKALQGKPVTDEDQSDN